MAAIFAGIPCWEYLVASIVVSLGLGLVAWSWQWTKESSPEKNLKSQVLAMVGGGLISASLVAAVLFVVQSSIQATQNEITWRDSIANAGKLQGFNPIGHSVKNMTLSDKDLAGAWLKGRDLAGSYMNDTNLLSAHLEGSNLTGVNLQRAVLSTAEMKDADLTDADLRGADFGHAAIEHVKTIKGAKVDANTCWPEHFEGNPHWREVIGYDAKGDPSMKAIRGVEWPAAACKR